MRTKEKDAPDVAEASLREIIYDKERRLGISKIKNAFMSLMCLLINDYIKYTF